MTDQDRVEEIVRKIHEYFMDFAKAGAIFSEIEYVVDQQVWRVKFIYGENSDVYTLSPGYLARIYDFPMDYKEAAYNIYKELTWNLSED